MNQTPICKDRGGEVRLDGGCLICDADAGQSCLPPKELDAIADVVLAYRPKPKSVAAKRRKRKASKMAKGKSNA